ncbi:glycosyltransferase family 4 protein [Sulfurovum sp.]|uniref:glycosyltransferase family 4 protein n=1 Tax=Sulfurovum sp. TaxID=1969726 RepID=UPI003562511D
MKILSVIETLGKGGAERVLVNTLPALQKLGIECEVAILFETDDLAEELEVQGIKVHHLDLSYKWNVVEGISKLNQLLKNNHYDIIHAHLFFAYFYTGLVKLFHPSIKIVTTFHNLGFDEYPARTFLKKIRKKLDCFIVTKLFDKKTAVSTAVKVHYEKHFHLSNIDVIYNSFPIDEFEQYLQDETNHTLEKYIQVKNNDFVVLTPGRFVEKKGHKYLIEAIEILNQKYSNLIFLFVGRGPLQNSLKMHAPKNVTFIPEMEHQELMQIYEEVDLIVIPSVYEAFGLVVGEAMIMKKGIVATAVDGIFEMVVNEEEGLLVPAKDSKALAKAIERLYADSALRDSLAENAKEKIKQFDTKIIAKQWKQYYEKMLNG